MEGVQGLLTSKAHRTKLVAPVTAAATLTTIGTFSVPEMETLFVGMVVATDALTEFEVQARASSSDSYVAVASAAADFTTPNDPILWVSGGGTDLTTAAVGNHHLRIDVLGVESIRIQAKSLGTATVALNAGAN